MGIHTHHLRYIYLPSQSHSLVKCGLCCFSKSLAMTYWAFEKMCRGVEGGKQGDGFCKLPERDREHQPRNNTRGCVSCELCGSRATLYCQADDAYLCRKCDQWVHGANFLALRHIRCFLCNTCQKQTQQYLIGASTEIVLPTLVSWSETNRCNSTSETKYSRVLKKPFLFLWNFGFFSRFLQVDSFCTCICYLAIDRESMSF